MNPLKRIYNYSVKIKPEAGTYELKLKVSEIELPIDINFKTISELSALVELLRDEEYIFYNISTGEIIIGWEPTGENDPKHEKKIH
jgi:hypothetical protein